MIPVKYEDDQNTNPARRDDNSCEDGGCVGVPLLVTTNRGDAHWPEIIEERCYTDFADCCTDEDGSCGTSDEVAAMARRETKEEVKEMNDEQLMEKALDAFAVKARLKFMQGIREHNPNGDKGLMRMTMNQKLMAIREEIVDLWFYVSAVEAAMDGEESK